MATWPFWPFGRVTPSATRSLPPTGQLLPGHPRQPGRHRCVRQDDAWHPEQYLGASAAQLLQHLRRLRLEEEGATSYPASSCCAPSRSARQDVLATYGIARQRISAHSPCRNFVIRKRYEGIRLEGRCSEAAPRLL